MSAFDWYQNQRSRMTLNPLYCTNYASFGAYHGNLKQEMFVWFIAWGGYEVIGPLYCGIRTFPLKCITGGGGKNWCKIGEGVIGFLPQTRSYFSGPEALCKISWKPNKNCGRRSDDKHTDRQTQV